MYGFFIRRSSTKSVFEDERKRSRNCVRGHDTFRLMVSTWLVSGWFSAIRSLIPWNFQGFLSETQKEQFSFSRHKKRIRATKMFEHLKTMFSKLDKQNKWSSWKFQFLLLSKVFSENFSLSCAGTQLKADNIKCKYLSMTGCFCSVFSRVSLLGSLLVLSLVFVAGRFPGETRPLKWQVYLGWSAININLISSRHIEASEVSGKPSCQTFMIDLHN